MSKSWCNRAVLILAVIAMTASCSHSVEESGSLRDDLPVDSLHEGDLVFRMGVSPESQVVTQLDSLGQYSHIGIVVNDQGTWKVVHAVPGESADGIDKVKSEPIDTFFLSTRAKYGAIMRLSDCDAQTAHRAAMKAMELAKREIPFDKIYKWSDTTYLYCTELVALSYSSAGVTLVDTTISNHSIVFPSDIYRNNPMITIFKF